MFVEGAWPIMLPLLAPIAQRSRVFHQIHLFAHLPLLNISLDLLISFCSPLVICSIVYFVFVFKELIVLAHLGVYRFLKFFHITRKGLVLLITGLVYDLFRSDLPECVAQDFLVYYYYTLVMQRFQVVYHGISIESLLLSIHELLGEYVYHDNGTSGIFKMV